MRVSLSRRLHPAAEIDIASVAGMIEVGEKDPEFLREVWVLYGLGALVILLRFIIRIKIVGLRGFQGDDFFALLLLIFYTTDAATVHICYFYGTNIEGSALARTQVLDGDAIAQFEFGAKEIFVAWYTYPALLWSMKGTMLCFYKRMTIGLAQQRLVNYLAIVVAISYIIVFLTVTFSCYPIHKNWQVVPDPGAQCTFKAQNFVVIAVCNILTDLAILAVPLPLLWKLQILPRRKIVICLLLSSGFFVISAALMRVILVLSGNPSALNINRWGVRETIVGIVAVNLPIFRPLFSLEFWALRCRPRESKQPKDSGDRSTVNAGHDLDTAGSENLQLDMTPAIDRSADSGDNNARVADCEGSDSVETAQGASMTPNFNQVLVHTMFHVTSEANSQTDHDDWRIGSNSRATAYYGDEIV